MGVHLKYISSDEYLIEPITPKSSSMNYLIARYVTKRL